MTNHDKEDPKSFSQTNDSLKYNHVLQTYDDVPLWFLFIDHDRQQEGPKAFDVREPGYHDAMINAFDYAFNNHEPFNAEKFKHIHHLCVKDVQNINSNEREFNPGMYGIPYSTNVSPEALDERLTDRLIISSAGRRKGYDDSEFLAVRTSRHMENKLDCIESLYSSDYADDISEVSKKVTDKVNSLFTEYYEQMDAANNDEDTLRAIVRLCRKLEIGHFFPDGNQRTIVFVILNNLLVDNGFSPTILKDPSVFDGIRSANELIADVREGMERFMSCIPLKDNHSTQKNASVIPHSIFPLENITTTEGSDKENNNELKI